MCITFVFHIIYLIVGFYHFIFIAAVFNNGLTKFLKN